MRDVGKGLLGAVLACILLAACDIAVGSEPAGPSGPTAREGREARADRKQGSILDRKTGATPNEQKQKQRRAAPAPRPTRDPAGQRGTFLVTRIVDGDTLELGNGETVRLVGIDTPEVGECGYDAASVALARLVSGRQVRLGRSDEDRDYYGRLLRYVDVGSTDAGLRLIRSGLAIARYDSRDGYGFHPREPKYIKADQASKAYVCAKPVPLLAQPKQKKNCAPGYSPCIPPYPPDLNCPDIGHPVTVTGSDPHGLDRDGDGIACEWS